MLTTPLIEKKLCRCSEIQIQFHRSKIYSPQRCIILLLRPPIRNINKPLDVCSLDQLRSIVTTRCQCTLHKPAPNTPSQLPAQTDCHGLQVRSCRRGICNSLSVLSSLTTVKSLGKHSKAFDCPHIGQDCFHPPSPLLSFISLSLSLGLTCQSL